MSERERFRRVAELFRAVRALPPEQREPFLAAECAGDATLLRSIRSLLAADGEAVGVLDRAALLSVDRVLSEYQAAQPAVPGRIGPFRVVRLIGEGGMGSVYEAEQQNPKRSVALKLLRGSAGQGLLARRFMQEAEILGQLVHPGIAQIFESGALDDGTPFFAMELVRGESLTEYARARRLDLRQRLDLFLQICEAVHFAHRRGVIHRDLKPANILVTDDAEIAAGREPGRARELPADRSSADPPVTGRRPKILDFGIARLTDCDRTVITQRTAMGELLGTVQYMSPEQAAGDPTLVDHRSDVYSLGVILYELLTDRLPLDVRRLMIHEAVRVIREDEPVPIDSVLPALRGDIATILAKSLEKDRSKRYESAADFSADIRRFLDQKPVAARPASTLYRLMKFTRRNRGVAAGVALAFLALLTATVVSTRHAIHAERARLEEGRLRLMAERQVYRSSVQAASGALRRHEVAEARRHLEGAPAPHRGWEWRHLHARLDDSLDRHSTGFSAIRVAISPDGTRLAACNSGGRIGLWDLATWRALADHHLTGTVSSRRVERLVFSADGTRLRADTRSDSVHLDAAELTLLDRDSRAARCRSPDGRFAIRSDAAVGLVLEEYAGGREVVRLAPAADETISGFSEDGALVAVGSRGEPGLRVYDCDDGMLRFERADVLVVARPAFDSTGRRLAVAAAEGAALLLDVMTGCTIHHFTGHETAVVAIALSRSGDRVATVTANGTIRVWNAESGALRTVMLGHQTSVIAVSFSPDGDSLWTAAVGGDIGRWDARADAAPFTLPMPDCVYGVSFSPDGSLLAAASLGGPRPLRIWDASSLRERFAGLDGHLSALAFDREGGRIAAGRSLRGQPTSILTVDGESVGTIAGHNWRTDWVAFGNDGRELISLSNGGQLRLNDVSTGEALRRMNFLGNSGAEGCRAAISPDGATLVVASRNKIHLLDAHTWRERGTLVGHAAPIYALSFDRSGTRLVSGGGDCKLLVWDIAGERTLAVMAGHTREIFAAAFSPDGTRIVSAGRDRVIRVWNAESFDEVTQLHGHTSLVYSLAFSPDGRTLVSGGGDDAVRLWSDAPYRETAQPRPAE